MAKLSDHEDSFLRLILRSPDRGDGWRTVSSILWRLVEGFGPKELIEFEEAPEGGGKVRLSDAGKIVVRYLVSGFHPEQPK